jgi:hypothetical protein
MQYFIAISLYLIIINVICSTSLKILRKNKKSKKMSLIKNASNK